MSAVSPATSKPSLRVVVLTPWFPNRSGDREGNFIHDSTEALAEAGTAVSVLVARPWRPGRPSTEKYRALSAQFDAASLPHLNHAREVKYFRVPRNKARSLTSWRRRRLVEPALRNMVQEAKADLIHAHTEDEAALAVRVGRAAGIPVVVTVHGINTAPAYLADPAHRAEVADALNTASRVILVGEPLQSFVKEISGSDANFRVVPNGVSIGSEDATSILDQPEIRFISVSNLHEGKGIDIALNALHEISERGVTNWRYTIVGDGKERKSLEALAGDLGLARKVAFFGAQENQRVRKLLRDADIFVLPSYIESFGIAYLEAMASGLLSIGVEGQGPSAFIEDGKTGFLIEPRDSSALADCLLKCAADRDGAKRIAAEGAKHVRTYFTWEVHAQRLIEVYREALAERHE